MKVLLINGSPHQHGATDVALNEVANKLKEHKIETEILWLGTKAMQGCIACGNCSKTGKCVFNDLVNETNARAAEFDAMVVGGPVYYGGICGQLTAFLDRLFYCSHGAWKHKLGASVVTCRRAGNTAAYQRLNQYFGISNMPIVTSRYWNLIHCNIAEEARQDEEGLQTMRVLGENMAWLLKCIQAGKENGVQDPVYEKAVFTNFIR